MHRLLISEKKILIDFECTRKLDKDSNAFQTLDWSLRDIFIIHKVSTLQYTIIIMNQ